MKRIRNITTLLDLTYIDPIMAEYSAFFSGIAEAEKVFFLHVIQEYNLPDKGGRELPDGETLYRAIQDRIREEVENHFNTTVPFAIETRAETEDASNAIIEFINETETDIVLIGQKYGANREARYGHKISAKAGSDTLFVPETATSAINKILCAIDCSDHSEEAFRKALDLAAKTGAEMASYFLYDTTRSYFPATTLSSAAMEQERSRKQYGKFLERFDLTPDIIPCHYKELGPSENQADGVYEAAVTENADFLVVGAAGDPGTATSLLGNMAENLYHMEKKIPLLIVRNQETKRFGWL